VDPLVLQEHLVEQKLQEPLVVQLLVLVEP
jgi:hypothetical protein